MLIMQARAKIKRANHHIEQIESRIAALHETRHSLVKTDPKTREEILIHDLDDPPAFEDLALILGDAIHNLNCALDYVWLETITRMAPSLIDDKAKFPVRKKVQELEGWLKKAAVDSLSPALYRFMVDEIGPHPRWQLAIWPVHQLDIRDKHRLLIPVLSHGNIDGIEVIDESGTQWGGSGSSSVFQKPPYCIRYQRGIHIKNKGRLTAEIVIEDANATCGLPIPETLMVYSDAIMGTVEAFERFLRSQEF